MSVRIYCCGGTGLNIGQRFKSSLSSGDQIPGVAEALLSFIDTSRANLGGEDNINAYLLRGAEGSGSIRSTNANPIKDVLSNLLMEHPPEQFNIVISSGGGGSGSVFGPLITAQLLDEGKAVIVLFIADSSSKMNISNNLNTLRTYDNIARKRDKPVVLHLRENTIDGGRKTADNDMITAISMLLKLFSGKNRELDNQDVYNWINYNRVTDYSPGLASLQFSSDNNLADINGNVVSVITLTKPDTPIRLGQVVDYHRLGFVPEETADILIGEKADHFVVEEGFVQTFVASYEKELKDIESKAKGRIKTTPIIQNVNKDDDLIL